MTVARKPLIDLQSTPYHHVVNRCVRRAFLCGTDHYSGLCYEHRRQWILDEVKTLSDVYAIDICAYAIMSNHYHLVLRVNREEASTWSTREVVTRWCQLYSGPSVAQRYWELETLSPSELYSVNELARTWRQRLYDISWFMSRLNHSIACQANAEDQCRGHLWEGRFKSQALLDEGALLTCMMYVDLNPIRAGMADSLELSDFTSIQERIFQIAKTLKRAKSKPRQGNEKKGRRQRSGTMRRDSEQTRNAQEINKTTKDKEIPAHKELLPFMGSDSVHSPDGIPFNLIDYLDLIDWTGRILRTDKRGAIPAKARSILESLSINDEAWVESVSQFELRFGYAIGADRVLKHYRHHLSTHRLKCQRAIQQLYRQTEAA